ncbi:hypothetical protein CASFOL_022238 [Castilleja foliolosa]|uniref:Uncharacterized protein n=1 Tax=Castilleja foliolosa TaxID=1961234 RepID=A0ABD3CXE7_9LAMI
MGNQDSKETTPPVQPDTNRSAENPSSGQPGMNGAVEVRTPDPDAPLTTLEFGKGVNETLMGYCPVSNKIEPCVWFIEPADNSDPAKIRISF